MFKNFSKNVALGACLASMLMINGGWGMTDIENNNTNDTNLTVEPSINSNISKKMKNEETEISDSNSGNISPVISSNESINTIPESNSEWIQDNKELIDQACGSKTSFIMLLNKLSSCSVERRKELYNIIEESWNDENVFGANVLDDGTFIFFRIERY